MFVSVVIPVYNDTARLRLCLDALERQTYPGDAYEAIVVDNGSDTPVASTIGAYRHVRIAVEPTPGAYAARNAGLEIARGEIIAFTDADCLPEPQWLAAGVAALGDRYDFAGGWIQTVPRDLSNMSAVERYALFWSRQQPRVLTRAEAATGNLFMRRSAVTDVGRFDAAVKSGSDYEWCHRATTLGKRFTAATDARVYHPARRTLREITKRERRFTGGQYVRARRRGRRAVLRLGAHTVHAGIGIIWSVSKDNTVAPTWAGRIAVALVACAVSTARIVELGRLAMGAEPQR